MKFYRRANVSPRRLGILPGAFNPPTIAHLALARAALAVVDEALLVLPRGFPHKAYHGAPFGDRIELLRSACEPERAMSVAASEGGLFSEIAGECREAYGPGVRLSFICGRDAAERIVGWDYGTPGAISGMLRQFDLLVAARGGPYAVLPEFSESVEVLPFHHSFEGVSATEVRARLRAGKDWEDLVPRNIVEKVREIYSRHRLH